MPPLPLTGLVFVLLSAGPASAQNNRDQNSNSQNGGSQIANPQSNNSQRGGKSGGASLDVARGKYIVEGVAMCGQCHTPTDGKGNPDRARLLQGAPVICLSPQQDPNWPLSAPRIGGTPPANDADMIKLLTTGIWTTGTHLRPPMPQFRMDRSDAEAVVAYLKSLTRQE